MFRELTRQFKAKSSGGIAGRRSTSGTAEEAVMI
jgi:hypothetical protein